MERILQTMTSFFVIRRLRGPRSKVWWIRKCIETAYDAAKLDPVTVNAHKVRAVAYSLRHYKEATATLEEICEVGR